MKPKVLFVDDEPHVLASFQVSLRRVFSVHVAHGPEEGLKRLKEDGPFPVVVSDLKMPGMNGVQFLAAVQQTFPDTVRLMLTGVADMESAIAAVNRGQVFRFLTKPCPHDVLRSALDAAMAQHALEQAERELLRGALRGSVKLLTDVLATLKPAVFGRSERLTRLALVLGEALGISPLLHLELAAMLCQLGSVALAEPLLLKLELGQDLTPHEANEAAGQAEIGAMLLENIPRMSRVAEIIRCQHVPHVHDPQPPLEARVLSVCLDYAHLLLKRMSKDQALEALRSRPGQYDPRVLDALAHCSQGLELAIQHAEAERSALASIPEVLREAASSTSALGRIMQREDVRRLLLGMESLHTPPSLLVALNRELNLPDPSLGKVAEMVAQAPAMAASLLRVVNSPMFQLLKPVTDVFQAVTFLGTETMRGLVVGVHLFSLIPAESSLAWLSRPLWRHCLQTAHFARAIALEEGAAQEFASLCFVAGMLHDIGKVIFAAQHAEAYQDTLRAMRDGRPELAAEKLLLGAHHAEVGAALLGVWGLPEDLLRAVRQHHAPGGDLPPELCAPAGNGDVRADSPAGFAIDTPADFAADSTAGAAVCPGELLSPALGHAVAEFIPCPTTPTGMPASLVVHVANWLDHSMAGSLHVNLPHAGLALDMVSLNRLGLDERLPAWRTRCELTQEERSGDHEA